jgi:hypothetical protein
MSELNIFRLILFIFIGLGGFIFILLFFVSAPYGRHARSGWGPGIKSKWGWLIMEAPASLLFFLCYIFSLRTASLVPVIFLLIWQSHYFHRAFFYPFTLKGNKKMPLVIMAFGILFNAVNTYFQARWIFRLSPEGVYSNHWLKDFRFILGVILFYIGYMITKKSDGILRSLRKPGETVYKVPYGFLFNKISCPNYLGEIIEWSGWAVAVWSWPGLFFAVWTIAVLAPRARSHHRWYKKHFAGYPVQRKALIPYVY